MNSNREKLEGSLSARDCVDLTLGFLNRREGRDWVLERWREKGDSARNYLSMFRQGKTTALLIHPEDIVAKPPLSFNDHRAFLVVERSGGEIATYFGLRISNFSPVVMDPKAVKMTERDLRRKQFQEAAKGMALTMAARSSGVTVDTGDCRAVIFSLQTLEGNSPFKCMVLRPFSPAVLAEKLGPEGSRRMFESFYGAIVGGGGSLKR